MMMRKASDENQVVCLPFSEYKSALIFPVSRKEGASCFSPNTIVGLCE